jgi:hypothetical protein
LDTETNLNDEKSEIDYDCLNESNATVDLLKQYHGEESKEMLCFIKCRFRKQNFIYEDGTVGYDLLEKRINELVDENQEKNFDCLKTMPQILSCDDMKILLECIKSI